MFNHAWSKRFFDILRYFEKSLFKLNFACFAHKISGGRESSLRLKTAYTIFAASPRAARSISHLIILKNAPYLFL
jgi:hypothetical protein